MQQTLHKKNQKVPSPLLPWLLIFAKKKIKKRLNYFVSSLSRHICAPLFVTLLSRRHVQDDRPVILPSIELVFQTVDD